MDKEITIVTVHNQFDRTDNDRQVIPFEGKNLFEIKEELLPKNEEVDFSASVNGQVIPYEQFEITTPMKGDCIVFTAKMKYESVVGIVAAIVYLVADVAVTTFVCYAIAAIAAVLYAGLMIGLNMLVNALFAPDVDVSGGSSSSETSQLYSWNPATTNQQGVCVAKMYGETRTYGNCIAVNTEAIGTDSYLNVLIGLNLGPVYEIYDFLLNDQEEDLFEGVSFETRGGYILQSPISNFNDTKVEYSLSRLVEHGSPVVYKTIGDDFEGVEVDVSFPKGLYHMNDSGGIESHSIDIRVELVDCDDESLVYLLTSHTHSTYIGEKGHWSFGYWSGGFLHRTSEDSVWIELYAEPSIVVKRRAGTIRYWFWESAGTIIHNLEGLPESGGDWYLKGFWRWVDEGAVYATEFFSYVHVKNKVTDIYTVTFKSEVPKKGHYYIRVTKLTEDISDIKYADEVNLSAVREVQTDDFSYPRMTLVGIKALATDQLSGTLGFSCMMKGSLIRVYDGVSAWTVEYNRNPAWVCYDVLTQPVFKDPSYACVTDANGFTIWYRCMLSNTASALNSPTLDGSEYWDISDGPSTIEEWALGGDCPIHTYKKNNNKVYRCIYGHTATAATEPGVGASWSTYWVNHTWTIGQSYLDITDAGVDRYEGIQPESIDYVKFKEWADFCDEMVDDGEGGTEKRFIFNGGFDSEFSLWEAAIRVCMMSRAMIYWKGSQVSVVVDKASDPVQLFSVGNIIQDSFEETYLPYEDRAGEIEISFMNEDNNYERDTFTIYNTDMDCPTNKVTVQLLGTTKPSQAWRTGQFLLLCNQYLKKTISFKADIDAIACTIGDVISVQHDVPRWGIAGGRVESATINSVTIDTEVTIEVGKTYSVMIRLSDDTLVTRTISNSPGTTNVLTVSTPFTSVPLLYDVYAFGESDIVTKPFRVQSLEQDGDQKITLVCLEYNENVYSVDTGTPIVPVTDYTSVAPIAAVNNVSVKQVNYFDDSGAVKREIYIQFSKPENPFYSKAIIYYTEDDGAIVQAGETTDVYFHFECKPLKAYVVYISSVSFSGKVLARSEWSNVTITTTDDPPPTTNEFTVTGLQILNSANDFTFYGRDCIFTWNMIVNILTSDVGAGEEVNGAGGFYPDIWFKDYQVDIYNTSGTLLRTEFVTDSTYTYTYEKNVEDNITPISSFEIRVTARDAFYRVSTTSANLTVTNGTPDPITNLSATSVVGGVSFSWDKSDETDLQCYYVRVKVGSGEYSDWVKVTDTSYIKHLTGVEITAYGTNPLITLEVQVMDVYNQVSSSVTEDEKASTIADNLFQLIGSKSAGTGNISELYDGIRNSGGVTI